MTALDKTTSRRIERCARWTAIGAGLAAIGLGCVDPGDFPIAYRFVVFAALAPAVGCLIFTLIHRLTGGEWADGLRPYLLAGVSLLPWIWVLALPLLFLPSGLNLLAKGGAPFGQGYAGLPMVALRSLVYAAIFFWLRWAVSPAGGAAQPASPVQRPWVGPAGLLVLVFTLTLLGDDWIASLEPDWHSTGFALVWMTGQAVAGLSLALLGGWANGAQAGSLGKAGQPRGIDWGNLMLAALLAWCYVAFAQFLIIWAGNQPAEISWFTHRAQGLWSGVPLFLAVFTFLLPFALLLSRRFKARTGGLAAVAGTLLLGQGIYTAWLILPAAGRISPAGWLLVLALLAAGGAVFVERYVTAVRRLGRASA
jgi:hypothetical protein